MGVRALFSNDCLLGWPSLVVVVASCVGVSYYAHFAVHPSTTAPKKRKGDGLYEEPMFGGSKGGGGSGAKKATKGVDEEAIDALFSTLADEDDPDQMGLENIAAFSEKLGIDPMTDVRLLVLMWRLKATTKPGTILRKEFVSGMANTLRKDSIEGIQSLLPSLDPGFLERQEFRDFYKFVFQFQREGTHKTIEKDTVAVLLPMVLDKNRAPHLEHFVEFLKVCSHQRITLDQWDSFLQFQYNVAVDLSNYDEDGACTFYLFVLD